MKDWFKIQRFTGVAQFILKMKNGLKIQHLTGVGQFILFSAILYFSVFVPFLPSHCVGVICNAMHWAGFNSQSSSVLFSEQSPMPHFIANWYVAAVLINIVSICGAILYLMIDQTKHTADVPIAGVLGCLALFTIITLSISKENELVPIIATMCIYLVYIVTDLVGMSKKKAPHYKYPLIATDIPAFVVTGFFLLVYFAVGNSIATDAAFQVSTIANSLSPEFPDSMISLFNAKVGQLLHDSAAGTFLAGISAALLVLSNFAYVLIQTFLFESPGKGSTVP